MSDHTRRLVTIITRRVIAVMALALLLAPAPAISQQIALSVKPVAQKTVTALPAGPLFWRIENFDTAENAQSAAGATALVVQAANKVWLFTLGAAGGHTPGGTLVREVGPIAAPVASSYLLRINEVQGPPGSVTPVHTHAGSEAFYVLAGESSQKTPDGVMRTPAGQSMPGHGAGVPMQVSSSGSVDLESLVMFVVDANKPFSSPAAF